MPSTPFTPREPAARRGALPCRACCDPRPFVWSCAAMSWRKGIEELVTAAHATGIPDTHRAPRTAEALDRETDPCGPRGAPHHRDRQPADGTAGIDDPQSTRSTSGGIITPSPCGTRSGRSRSNCRDNSEPGQRDTSSLPQMSRGTASPSGVHGPRRADARASPCPRRPARAGEPLTKRDHAQRENEEDELAKPQGAGAVGRCTVISLPDLAVARVWLTVSA